jgi:putative membrane protein
VYGTGDDPDYRFSFANERTFLAWIRTALALLAGGVAMDAFELSIPAAVQEVLAAVLVVLAMLCAVASWVRWARAERAMRRDEALPAANLSALVAAFVVLVAVAVLIVGV